MSRHVERWRTSTRTGADGSGRIVAAGDCVHCGFCLPSCPTYQLWGEEMDSPRGRIHLIRQILETAAGQRGRSEPIDRCLGCMACVPACPSGVQVRPADRGGQDLGGGAGRAAAARRSMREGGRARVGLPAGPADGRCGTRSSRLSLTRPGCGRAGPLRAAQRTRLDRLAVRSKSPPGWRRRPRPRSRSRQPGGGAGAASGGPGLAGARSRPDTGRGQRRAVVGMLTGCVQQVFFPQVNIATARVLAAEGCDVVIPPGQGCCGALSLHGGRRAEARRSRADDRGVRAGGRRRDRGQRGWLRLGDEGVRAPVRRRRCLGRPGRRLLRAGPRPQRVPGRLGPVAPRCDPLPITVAYHDACHLGHAQRITASRAHCCAARSPA